MIDIKEIRENAGLYIQAAQNKRIDVDIEKLLEIDQKLKDVKARLQDIATEKNRIGKTVAKLAGAEKETALKTLAQFKQDEANLDTQTKELQPQFDALMLQVPQPADADVPTGKDDTENVELRREGEVRKFDFEPKDHVQLGYGARHHRYGAGCQAVRRAELLPQG